MTNKDENVNLAPPLTEEQLRQDAELQKQLAQKYSVTNQSEEAFAHRVIADNYTVLVILSEQAAGETGNTKERLEQKIEQLQNDTAQWLAKIGQFFNAAGLAASEKQSKLYLAYLEAEQRADGVWCEHNQVKDGQPNFFIEFDYFSEARGKKTSMVKCAECEHRNAMDTPDLLQKMRDLRRKYRGAQKGESPKADRAILESKGVIKDGKANLSNLLKNL